MEMKQLNSGRLRAAGYDRATRSLRVELDDGSAIDYAGVGEELWRRLAGSASAWSFYRDNIEEEFTGQRSRVVGEKKSNPLDDLFRS
jgi:hypothetical protein